MTRSPPTRPLPRPLRPFRHRDYRLLAASVAASLFASGLWIVAIAWQVIALGGGPSELSLVATAAALGLVVNVLIGGVAADRLPRRAVLITVEAVRIVAATAAGALALTGTLQLWQLAVVAYVIGSAEAFFFPAYSAILPTLLPADELLAANGVEGALRPMAQRALGPALAGVLVGAFVPGVALLGTAAGYLLALLPLLAIRGQPVVVKDEPTSAFTDLREGFAYLRRTGWLLGTLAFAVLTVLVVLGPIEVLIPFAVRDRTGGGAAEFALVLTAYGIGGVLGSIAVSAGRLPRRYLTAIMLLWGAGSAPLVVIGLTDQLWVLAAAMFAVGFADVAATVIWGTLLQRRVPPHLLGRVSSLDFFVSLALLPVSMAIAGPLGELIGIPLTFVLAGTIPAFLGVAALLGWRLYRDEIAHPLDGPARDGKPSTG